MPTTDDAWVGPDEEDQVRLRRAVPAAMLATPYLSSLHLTFERYEADQVTLRLPFRPDLTNDGTYYHGGVIATVMDTAGAAAAWSNHDFSKGSRGSTVTMSLQYVGACKHSDLLCDAQAVRRGRELIFAEMTATDADAQVVAHGLLTYRIV
ncbi:MAG TPA: PaaI family thioesterase [Acidimicrobiales bacterium]|nr:PaaI family thioesterase [Acidimicrobiales bacterium]